MFDEDEEEPEEGEIREGYIPNEEYEEMPVREMIDPSLENWVHHTLHILPQVWKIFFQCLKFLLISSEYNSNVLNVTLLYLIILFIIIFIISL